MGDNSSFLVYLQNIQGFKECHIQIKHPSSNIRKFTMQMGDERILAPMSIFHPDIYGLQGKNLSKIPEKYQSDPTDPKDEDYIAQTMSKHEQVCMLRRCQTFSIR